MSLQGSEHVGCPSRQPTTSEIPRLSVIDSTTPGISFAEALRVYRDAGVDGIGITEARLQDDREDLARFRDSGLRASGCFLATASILPSPLLPGDPDPRRRIADTCRGIHRLAPFQPDHCFIVSGPLGLHQPLEARRIIVDGARHIADTAAEYGITLAVELMAPSLASTLTFVNTIDSVLDVINEIDRENVAVAGDVWHLSESPPPLAGIQAIAAQFASFHVNDRREPTRSWCDRVLPGAGVADLPGILGSLDAGGFAGWFELEILSDDGSVEHDFEDSLWKRDPFDVVSAGRAGFIEAWQARRAPSLQ